MCDEVVRVRSGCIVSTKKDNGAWVFFRKMRNDTVFIKLIDKAFEV
jgi:hypothetical protein